ncbi:MAG: hypothetical protein AB1348_03750 [Nitrospirota bacterium]
MSKGYAICYFCGKSVEYTDCSDKEVPPEDARCEMLKGWLSVRQWKGIGLVDDYDLCSFDCLQKWVVSQLPKIPKEYLKAFEENGDKAS